MATVYLVHTKALKYVYSQEMQEIFADTLGNSLLVCLCFFFFLTERTCDLWAIPSYTEKGVATKHQNKMLIIHSISFQKSEQISKSQILIFKFVHLYKVIKEQKYSTHW